MAYINFKLLQDRKLSTNDFILLQLIKQQKNEDLESFIKEAVCDDISSLDRFFNLDLITSIKGDKKKSSFSKLRLTNKGSELLNDIETVEIEEQDVILFDWIKNIYLSNGKDVGNSKKAKTNIAFFRTHSGISKNNLAILLKYFLNDEKAQSFSLRVDYVFWKPTNVFQSKFDLNDSKLYQYYLMRKDFFDEKFNEND